MAKHVLVVDDHDEVRAIIALTLEDSGYRVTEANSGAAMRERLRDGQPIDAVILDWSMPGETGADLARHAKGLHLAVIIVSGNLDPMDFAAANDLPLLVKPFNAEALLATLRAATEGRAQQ